MLETIKEGGWLMIPIFISSVVASAIILERLWSLDAKRILPKNLLPQVWVWLKNDQLDSIKLRKLHLSSPLGHILAAGLINYKDGKQAMTQAIERAAAETIRDLECYLSTLGIIAAVCPLLGLLGTVIGMIQVFGDIMFGVFILFFLIILIISFLFDSCWALAPKAKAALIFFFRWIANIGAF